MLELAMAAADRDQSPACFKESTKCLGDLRDAKVRTAEGRLSARGGNAAR